MTRPVESVIAFSVQRLAKDATTRFVSLHCGSFTFENRGLPAESAKRLPVVELPFHTNLRFCGSNGPTTSGTPRPYNMLLALIVAGPPEVVFTIQLVCQFSASRAQTPVL